MSKELDYIADLERENRTIKSLLYCTVRSCNNCGKVNCENFQRQRIDCCGHWVSYKDYIKELEADNDARKYAMAMSEKVEKQLREENAKLESDFRICEKNADIYYDQRTKAKELLNEFVRISKASDEDFEHDYSELIGETEQFLEKVK